MMCSLTCAPTTDLLRKRLSTCADDINSWCNSRRLQLNASKTEAIWFGSKSNLAQLNKRDRSNKVCSSIIQPAAIVRDLGLLLDSELSMKQHVTKVAAICYYHLRRLRQIRRRVGSEVTIWLVLALLCLALTIAIQHWPACRSRRPHHCSECRTQQLDCVRTWTEGACYSKPSPAPLATSPLAGPVQDMLLNALDSP